MSSINSKYLMMYQETIFELNQKVTIFRDEFKKFDLIFDELYNSILNNNINEIRSDRRLIWVFLHYMYWKCDLGVD